MKILHLAESFAPTGGVETYVIELMPFLAENGHENVVICRKNADRSRHDKQAVYVLPKTQDDSREADFVEEVARQEEPDAIYIHDIHSSAIVSRAIGLAPALAYVHNFIPVCPGLGKYYRVGDEICTRAYGAGCVPRIYVRRCATARHPLSVWRIMRNTRQVLSNYRNLRRLLVASSFMKTLLVQNGVHPERVAKVPYFIPTPPESMAAKTRDQLQQVLFAGRLEVEKGLPYLLEAFRRIRTPCELVVAGEGTRRIEYEQLANKLGLASRVRFLGWMDEHALFKAYETAGVFVMSSIWPEPFGKVGLEALAHETPVVAFNVGGISDWLKDGWNGFLVPPKDVSQLADRIEQLLNDSGLSSELGANGRDYVNSTYTREAHLSSLLPLLEDVVKR